MFYMWAIFNRFVSIVFFKIIIIIIIKKKFTTNVGVVLVLRVISKVLGLWPSRDLTPAQGPLFARIPASPVTLKGWY